MYRNESYLGTVQSDACSLENPAQEAADDQTVEPAVERPSLAEHEAAATDKLSDYAVIDAAAGKVRLPIERAKALVVSENSK